MMTAARATMTSMFVVQRVTEKATPRDVVSNRKMGTLSVDHEPRKAGKRDAERSRDKQHQDGEVLPFQESHLTTTPITQATRNEAM